MKAKKLECDHEEILLKMLRDMHLGHIFLFFIQIIFRHCHLQKIIKKYKQNDFEKFFLQLLYFCWLAMKKV